MPSVKTDELSERLRLRAVRPETGQVLISRIEGTAQEADLTEPPNCKGLGRIRHFHSQTEPPWPENPLPIIPASEKLGRSLGEVANAQVFQNAACNWRCWYCYVPFNLLAANEKLSAWLTSDELVSLYRDQPNPPLIIDCSGGQPDLIPEWIPWMMTALRQQGLSDQVYLWSDDNLSTDYFWKYLTAQQRRLVADYEHYGRVCCFKGFDTVSFSFNTKASEKLFDRQFDIFARLLQSGIDLYAYATFTSPVVDSLRQRMSIFVDRLMEIAPSLPLRLVPLRIANYGVVQNRVGPDQAQALLIQDEAIEYWNAEINTRFTAEQRATPISQVDLRGA